MISPICTTLKQKTLRRLAHKYFDFTILASRQDHNYELFKREVCTLIKLPFYSTEYLLITQAGYSGIS